MLQSRKHWFSCESYSVFLQPLKFYLHLLTVTSTENRKSFPGYPLASPKAPNIGMLHMSSTKAKHIFCLRHAWTHCSFLLSCKCCNSASALVWNKKKSNEKNHRDFFFVCFKNFFRVPCFFLNCCTSSLYLSWIFLSSSINMTEPSHRSMPPTKNEVYKNHITIQIK